MREAGDVGGEWKFSGVYETTAKEPASNKLIPRSPNGETETLALRIHSLAHEWSLANGRASDLEAWQPLILDQPHGQCLLHIAAGLIADRTPVASNPPVHEQPPASDDA